MRFDRIGAETGNFLSYISKRQETIAANIANSDTPGYKTQDVDAPGSFEGALADFSGSVRDASGLAARNDGNNVSIDREARLLAENSMKFNLATQLLKGEFKGIRSAIDEGRAA